MNKDMEGEEKSMGAGDETKSKFGATAVGAAVMVMAAATAVAAATKLAVVTAAAAPHHQDSFKYFVFYYSIL